MKAHITVKSTQVAADCTGLSASGDTVAKIPTRASIDTNTLSNSSGQNKLRLVGRMLYPDSWIHRIPMCAENAGIKVADAIICISSFAAG